jgi:hypothetical protein
MQKLFKLFAGLLVSLMFVSTASFGVGETRILQFENPHSALDFEEACIGSSVTKQLKLLNNGNSSLTVTDIRFHDNLDGAYVSDFPGSLVIEANSSVMVNITFTPTAEQPYLGLVYVESDRTNVDQDRSHVLSGTGTTACPVESKILAFANPHSPLDFGDEVCIGSSVSKVLTLFNNGTAPLTVTSIRFHENLNGAYVLNSAGSFVIDANGSADVNITFTPTEAVPSIGLVYVESDRTNIEQDRSHLLSGTGVDCGLGVVAPSEDTRILAFENPHSALDFGTASTCTPSTQALTLFNNGNSPLAITDVRFHENLEGAYTSDFPGSLVIEANSSAVVNIDFTPTAEQPYVGLVYVESNRTNTDQDRSHVLSGMGVACTDDTGTADTNGTKILAFESPHTPFNFNDVDVNTSVTLPFKIMNTGTDPLTVNEVRFHSSLEGSVTTDFTPDVVIPASDFILVNLTFTPTAEQTYAGLIYVESDRTNVDQDRSLLLVGTGIN